MPDSLFGSDSDSDDDSNADDERIPGLYLFPDAVPADVQHALTLALSESVWPGPASNQAMLFDSPTRSALPSFLAPVLDLLPAVLAPLPPTLRATIFDPTKPRQCILNLYRPGEGISSHVDLPARYEDGIVGISLLSSTDLEFTRVDHDPDDDDDDVHHHHVVVRLDPGSVYVLSGPARYDYAHGIAYRDADVVVDRDGTESTVKRGVRMSVTLRRMRDGAEVVGPSGE
ncbi:hypothetical protein JCM11491_004584 [Sporobolomyces phaffii]